MSEELVIFKKRLRALEDILDVLDEVNKLSEIQAIRTVLKRLQHVVKNAETLNTGGHFEWVDSKFVRALKVGQYICLEHVNLCSSAILDRLNPVFEPNGTLLLSEKGVSASDDNQSECVARHKQFRAFLTLDPKNGEISRAMRNRCVELNFNRESYSDDDLKQLVFENGIRDSHLIDWLLRIHERVKNITEFSTFNVSHLMKFAFLTSENLRLDMELSKAIFTSALEVYVRSSHIDLLGFGLPFYRNKLIQDINEELQSPPSFHKTVFDFENTIIRANNMSTLSMVRLQFEPFLATVHCLLENFDQDTICSVFKSLRSRFGDFNLKLDWNFSKYLLYILYEMSSMDDSELRHVLTRKRLSKFLVKNSPQMADIGKISMDVKVTKQQTQLELLQQSSNVGIGEYKDQNLAVPAIVSTVAEPNSNDDSSVEGLLQLNTKLHGDVKSLRSDINKALPWNQHIFPRLRDYNSNDLSVNEQLKSSAILLARLSIGDVNICNTTKLSQIDAVTYSKAVTNKIIPDSLNIDLITHLHPFLTSIIGHIECVLSASSAITYNQYVNLSCAYLWCERLQKVAERKLFTQKVFNDTIVDTLTLHFRWLSKYMLTICDDLTGDAVSKDPIFAKNLQKVVNYVTANYHPLSRVRKTFVKTLTNFAPFYDQKQVVNHEIHNAFENLTTLVPKLGTFEQAELNKRLRILVGEESATLKKHLFDKTIATEHELNWLNDLCFNEEVADEQFSKDPIADAVHQLKLLKKENETISEETSNIQQECDGFVAYCNSLEESSTHTDLTAFKLIIELMPVLEYFALRSLNVIQRGASRDFDFNLKYFQQIRSLGIRELSLINTVSGVQFKTCEKIWNMVCDGIIANYTNGCEFNEKTLELLPNGFYKTYSSFVRALVCRLQSIVLNSTTVNNAVCYNLDLTNSNDQKDSSNTSEQFVNGPMLTTSILPVLLDPHGNFKSSGLGDLDVWRNTLTSISKVVWNNVELIQSQFSFEDTQLQANISYGQKLLAELKFVQNRCPETSENTNFLSEFQSLIDELELVASEPYAENTKSCPLLRQNSSYRSAKISAILGSIELNLLTFMPLLDPVEKNRLKKIYVEDDQQHLTNLLNAYEFMRVIMDYRGLGETITKTIQTKEIELRTKHDKYSKKCALRPSQCVYSNLVKDVNHFLRTCCHPTALLSLISTVSTTVASLDLEATNLRGTVQSLTETVKRIEVWINNAQRFVHHTLAKYSTYYKDFVAPIESAISMLKFGLTGLKHILVKERDSICVKTNGQLGRLNDDGAISHILDNLIGFPCVSGLRILPTVDNLARENITIFTVLDKLDHKDTLHFM